MNYKNKYYKYKFKYYQLLESINKTQLGGANKWCQLPKNAKLYFGSGGSNGIIAVVNDRAYKYFPVFVYPSDTNNIIKEIINYNKYEIMVIKELNQKIVKPKLSPHIIKYYNYYKCNETPNNIFKNCPSYTQMLMSSKYPIRKCSLTYMHYPRKLIKPMYILEMEKADSSLSDEIIKISKQKFDKINIFLNRLYFQVFYTLETIKLKYPNYIHSDLFIRNIMTKNNNYNNDEYIRYHYKKMIFDVPANGLHIKLNDFGMNQLSKKFYKNNNLSNYKIINNPYRDYFSIIYYVYNGGNLGSNSLTNLIKNKDKLKQINKYFSKFININKINKIIKNKKKINLDFDWNKTQDRKVVKLLGLKKIDFYLKYFKNIFPYNVNHKIIEEYG